MPKGADADNIRGLYKLKQSDTGQINVNFVGSGTVLLEVVEAAKIFEAEFGTAADVFSATSFSELSRDAEETERQYRFDPKSKPRQSHVQKYAAQMSRSLLQQTTCTRFHR